MPGKLHRKVLAIHPAYVTYFNDALKVLQKSFVTALADPTLTLIEIPILWLRREGRASFDGAGV